MQGKPLDIIAWKIKKVFGPKNNTQNVTNIIGKDSLQTERNLYYPPSIWVHSTKRDHIPPIGKRKTHFSVSFLRDTCFFDAEKTVAHFHRQKKFLSKFPHHQLRCVGHGTHELTPWSQRQVCLHSTCWGVLLYAKCLVRNGAKWNYSNSHWETLGK